MASEQYKIPEHNVELLTKKIDKLNKAARRVGAEPIELKIIEIQEKETEVMRGGFLVKMTKRWAIVEIAGESPKLEGWTFLGTIDHSGPTNLVHSVPGERVPEEYWNRGSRKETKKTCRWNAPCDHCNTIRYRKETFVVRHEDGRALQVGRTCLADFLGHPDPSAVAKMCEWLGTLQKGLCDPESEFYGYSSEEITVDLKSILVITSAWIRRHGWVSRSKAYESGGAVSATANGVWSYAAWPPAREEYIREQGRDLDYRDEDSRIADKAMQWARKQKPSSSYVHNILAIVEAGNVSWRTAGYASSIVSCYLRSEEKAEKRRKELAGRPESHHVGELKERREFSVKVTGISYFETDFGSKAFIRMMDVDGNVIVWSATNDPDVAKDMCYRIKGTIRAHDAFRGVKQTVINRGVVVKEIKGELNEDKEAK